MSQSVSEQKLTELVTGIVKLAKQQGATSADVAASVETGYNVSTRLGEVETLEYNRDKGVGITVYFDQKKGSASTNDLTPDAVKRSVDAACAIAKQMADDDCAGLADADMMADNYPDLDLYHPWDLSVEEAIELAKACETTGMDQHALITNSEGATVNTHNFNVVYANSHGFVGSYTTTRHSLSCVLIAEQQGMMERDYYYTIARDAKDLMSGNDVAKKAAQRAVARLGAKKIATTKVPVVFHAEVASGLISHFLSAIRGSCLYRKSSFLLDHLNQQVFAEHVQIAERPHLKKALGSSPFDSEGVKTQDRDLIIDGVLQGYILSSYSARKLKLQTTGNAGGAHNIIVKTSQQDFQQLLKDMGTGLLVTEVMGQGVNIVTGDYSRGASGFWVENGEIQYPVSEITIAGNLRDMLKQIVTIANDVDHRRGIRTGSILVESMMIAGN